MTIIDVREPGEFAGGHVERALNIPLSSIAGNKQLQQLAKEEPLIVYCRSGARSAAALDYLKQQGFTSLTNGINQENTEQILKSS